MTLDYLIIGGGITGITAARLLQLAGVERLAILEAGAEPGGLCRTREIGGHVLDTGGGHFLCTKHAEVYDFIFRHIPTTAFNHFHRVSRIAIDGHEVDYPLESNLWQLPPAACAEYLVSVARNGEARGLPPPDPVRAVDPLETGRPGGRPLHAALQPQDLGCARQRDGCGLAL